MHILYIFHNIEGYLEGYLKGYLQGTERVPRGPTQGVAYKVAKRNCS